MTIDVLVIGAGIAGITAGIYLKRGNVKSLLLDKGAPGGKLNNIHRIDNYPGISSIPGPDLAMNLFNQASELGVEFAYGSVLEVRRESDGFRVRTDVEEYSCKAIIVATGVENKKLGIPGEDKYLGKGVSYCATCDGPFFKGKDVALIGNADHAVEDGIYLAGVVNHLYFLYPEAIASTQSHYEELSSFPNVELIPIEKSLRIEGEEKVTAFVYEAEGQEKALPVSAVFPLYGEKSSTAFLSPLGLENDKGFLLVDEAMQTSCPGVYACGDIIAKKLRQLVNAAGEAAVAATSAIGYVRSLAKK